MSNVSLSALTSIYQSYLTRSKSSTAQTAQNLNAVGTALQSGDLIGAQSALDTLEQGLSTASASSSATTSAATTATAATTQPFADNALANSDYQTLVTAVQSGNVSDAQTAFANLQNALKSGKTHGGHHHHGGGAPPVADTTGTGSTGNSDGSGLYVNVTV
jgi:ATP/maltotriose-dependent transcriptional regulator MalT